MAGYVLNNDLGGSKQNLSSSYKTIVSITAATATLCGALVSDVLIGTNGTPADNFVEWNISRQTTLGTGTAGVPVALNPQSRAAGSVGNLNLTVEPTITAASSVFYIGVNQRSAYRWIAAPGSELVVPAVNVNGLALQAKSAAYTSTVTGELLFTE